MKSITIIMAAVLAMFTTIFSGSALAQQQSTTEFKVTGNCSMCKKTIETAVKGKQGISYAEWNKDTKVMKVTYDKSRISEEQLQQKIADAGYDTEKKKAADKAYNSLHKCCQYRRTLHAKK